MQKMTKKRDDTTITRGSGNVFADLGLPNPEECLLKARLASLIYDTIEAREWTQEYAAKLLGVTQPDISNICRGRLTNFSVERLINFLSKFNQRITISIQDETQDLPPHEIIIAATTLEERQPVLS